MSGEVRNHSTSLLRTAVVDLKKQTIKLLETAATDAPSPFGVIGLAEELRSIWSKQVPILQVFAGPLTGTGAPGSGSYGFSWRGAQPQEATTTFCEGRLGAMMKHAGIDSIVFFGCANLPVYLNIAEEDMELCDASALRKLGIKELTDSLLFDNDWDDAAVLALAAADETGIAELVADYRFPIGWEGLAAVFAQMNLQGIVVAGAMGLEIKEPEEFVAACVAVYAHKNSGIVDDDRHYKEVATACYLSPWHQNGGVELAEDAAVEDAFTSLDEETLILRLLGLYWDERFPLPDRLAHGARFLTLVSGNSWSGDRLKEAVRQLKRTRPAVLEKGGVGK